MNRVQAMWAPKVHFIDSVTYDYDMDDFVPVQMTPDRRLLAAILGRAVTDYYHALKRKMGERSSTTGGAMLCLREIRDWFTQRPSNRPFSFFWICSHLDMDPVTFRAQVFAQTEEKIEREKQEIAQRGLRVFGRQIIEPSIKAESTQPTPKSRSRKPRR